MIKAWVVGHTQLANKYTNLRARLVQRIYVTMVGLADDLTAYIKMNKLSGQVVNVRTGNLRNSIKKVVIENGSQITAIVGSNVPSKPVPYAGWLENGTPAYDIVPKEKKALAFQWKGKQFILKKVHHPGIAGRFFMRDSLAEFKPIIIMRLNNAIKKEIGN